MDAADPREPVEVFSSRDKKPCQERALVLQAIGLPHRIEHNGFAFALLVPWHEFERAQAELGDYAKENVDWPPRYDAPPLLSGGGWGALTYAVILIFCFPAGRLGLFGLNVWAPGKMDTSAFLGGEFWRAATALTLHADVAHLAGNVFFGAGIAVLASHPLGSGLTWFGFSLAGIFGNALAAWLKGPGYASIGASTSVFGAVGLLAAYEWMRRHTLNYPPMRRFGPLAGGAVLFGFLGTSGERTDVLAHMTGFGCGLILGALFAFGRLPERVSPRGQWVLGAIAPLLILAAWALALE